MTPWIEHDGLSVPVRKGQVVQVQRADGKLRTAASNGPESFDMHLWSDSFSGWNWMACDEYGFPGGKIIRYRIPSHQAIEDLIAKVENMQPVVAG